MSLDFQTAKNMRDEAAIKSLEGQFVGSIDTRTFGESMTDFHRELSEEAPRADYDSEIQRLYIIALLEKRTSEIDRLESIIIERRAAKGE